MRIGPRRETPARGRVFVLFRAGLGLVFLAAFASLAVQLRLLTGSRGLLPWVDLLGRLSPAAGPLARFLAYPTLFLWLRQDAALTLVPVAGMLLALVLAAGAGGRWATPLLWFLYLSCITVGRDFFYYQWDNLLLETALLAVSLPGRGTLLDLWRGRAVAEPSRASVWLLRGLLFRLLFESGLSKIEAGGDTWLNLSAMTYYYETAPLPSWGGWLVQQAPLWFHHFSVLFTFFVELPLALCLFLPRPFRLFFFAVHLPFQVSIALTSNYGFFNLLSLVLSLTVLEDRDLDAAARLARRLFRLAPAGASIASPPPSAAAPARCARLDTALACGIALLTLPLALVEGLGYFSPSLVRGAWITNVRAACFPFRSVHVYHLFPGVLRERVVAEIQGTADGQRWEPYHLRYAPGDPRDPPPMTFLHNPRLPFHYSFWTLGRGGRDNEYIGNLARRLCCDPQAAAPLFRDDPFPKQGPRSLRIEYFRYRFGTRSDLALGNYWLREPVGAATRPFACTCSEGVGHP